MLPKFLSWDTVVTGPKDSLWWRDVACVGGKVGDCWFPSQVSSVLGNGNSILFWKEKWYGAAPLRDLFPRLFDKEQFKDCMVSDLFQQGSYFLNWNSAWLTSLSRSELLEKAELDQLLLGVVVRSDIADRRRWNSESSGMFSVKYVYLFLQSRLELLITEPGLLDAIHKLWKNDIPSKVGVFGWRLLLDKLPTRAALASK
ncbi:ribonuclease H, partial [Trifolium pratense]